MATPIRLILLLILVYTALKVKSQGFRRPSDFDPDPNPEPFAVLDRLGQKVFAPGARPPPPAPPPPPGQDDPLVDIVAKKISIPKEEDGVFRVRNLKLERYFPNMDIGQVARDYEGTDLEVIEWPGIISDKADGITAGTGISYQDFIQRRLNEEFIPLSFEGQHSIFKNYVCNRRLGTHIRAMGFRPINRQDPRYQLYNPFYFSYGPRSFHRDFVQPLYAPVSQLNRLAEGHKDPECQPIQPGKGNNATIIDPNSKLNHILDFTFSTNRIIFGMHCGILVVKPIDAPTNYMEAAKRRPDPDNYDDEDLILETYSKFIKNPSYKSQKFIGRINRLSSNVCCAGVCNDVEPLAVAYSYDLSNTEENLKRIYISLDHGESWDQKMIAPSETTILKLINGLYTRINLRPPEFISRRVAKAKATDRWVNDTDHVVRAILDGVEEKEAPTLREGEVFCAEIVSVQVVQEENGFLALCRTDLGDPLQRKHPQGVELSLNYAVFQYEISKFSPLVRGTMKSKRRLACTIVSDNLQPNVDQPREPGITLGRRGMNLIILGCESVLYHSINGGYTFWNAVFYVETDGGFYERKYQLPGFSIPLVAFDPDGSSMTFTFGDNYAVGFIAYTEEFRLLVGRVAETDGRIEDGGICDTTVDPCPACRNSALEPPSCTQVANDCLLNVQVPRCQPYYDTFIRFSTNRKFIPYYTNSGDIKFSVSVMHFLLDNANANAPKYEHRKAIRLIDIPFKLTDAIRPFFEENTAIADVTKGFAKCRIFAFQVDTRETSLDLNEKAVISVSVQDRSADAELGIYASLPQVLKIDVAKNNSQLTGALNLERKHVWSVTVAPREIHKDSIRLFEDTFFGSNYDLFSFQSANLVLTNPPAQRCHTQPRGSVLVNLGCSGKKLVVHEDYNRPQCQKFFGVWDVDSQTYLTYNFRLRDGEYDPEMLSFWRKREPKLFNRDGKDWIVEYDYKTFGCPIEPYRLENFEPDLRVLNLKESPNVTDTARGVPFRGQYIMIEVFGQGGFSYLKTVKEAKCQRAPLTLKTLLREWKDRRSVVFNAFRQYKSFHPLEVADPQNIWQKSNHQRCELPARRAAEHIDDLRIPEEDPYEVMQRGLGNAIIWDRKTRKDVYFFIAIDIDQQIDTFCDYTAYFAVSLNADIRSPPIHSVLRFAMVFLFLSILIMLGYYAYRTFTRRTYGENALLAKLERGAWEILLRYEKYLHEVEVHGNERVKMIDNVPTLILTPSKEAKKAVTAKPKPEHKPLSQGTAPRQSRIPDVNKFARQFSKQFK